MIHTRALFQRPRRAVAENRKKKQKKKKERKEAGGSSREGNTGIGELLT